VPVESDSGLYLQTLSTYIHLNPARAKLIRVGEQKLWEYPWSSYPSYVRKSPPPWLVTKRVLGSLGLAPGARSAYEAYMESRVLELGIRARRKELEAAWASLRRGWYVGGESFRKGLLKRVDRQFGAKGRSASASAPRLPHDQSRAEEMLSSGLAALGIRSEDLASLPKGQTEKLVLAWWLYGRTTVGRRWVAEQLAMGYETRVSQAVSLVESSRKVKINEMKRKLSRCNT
jgi:hypothetical protein